MRICVSTVFILVYFKTGIERSVKGPKLQGLHAEDAMVNPYLVLTKFGDLMQQITRSSVTIANFETITDLQSWCRIWPLNGSKHIRAKQKLHKNQRSLKKFLKPDRNFTVNTDNSMEFGKAFEKSLLDHFIARLHHIDRSLLGLLKEQCAE